MLQKKYNSLTKFKLLRKLIKENDAGLFDKADKQSEPADVQDKPKEDDLTDVQNTPKEDPKDIPGIFKAENPKLSEIYVKLMTAYEPQQLIYDNKEEKHNGS